MRERSGKGTFSISFTQIFKLRETALLTAAEKGHLDVVKELSVLDSGGRFYEEPIQVWDVVKLMDGDDTEMYF
ncbi:ankyrin repeat-containing protein [Corchorus olitorius]|uniref:Ankyrin repeat-containing protein n=1 Tax=Corchorus olitorius TaxID=93759 RepID=A0A1R3H031_9ROSI|nr:ankyrin repeat-containing protein [Corchorus olitorius]